MNEATKHSSELPNSPARQPSIAKVGNEALNSVQAEVRGRLIFITGGARSGKSRHAQELALQASPNPVYVATARKWDGEFRERIHRHQKDRDERWTSIEEEKKIGHLPLQGKTVVIDCITLWLTNFFVDTKNDIDACLEACKNEINELCRQDTLVIIISNEIGMGIHADTEIGRKFTDLQGWINQYIAAKADKVIFMVSGIPVMVKSPQPPKGGVLFPEDI